MYLLTPRGIEAKARVTAQFLRYKLQEHKALTDEIAQIRDEIERDSTTLGAEARSALPGCLTSDATALGPTSQGGSVLARPHMFQGNHAQ